MPTTPCIFLIFSLDTGGDSSGGSGSWASFPYFVGQWHIVSVVVLWVFHACIFEVLFKYTLAWICLAIFPHSSTPMWCCSIAHRPNKLILRWIIFLISPTGVPRLFVWCISRQNHLLPGWIVLGVICASTVLECVSLHNIHGVLFSFVGIHLQSFQTGLVHKCSS